MTLPTTTDPTAAPAVAAPRPGGRRRAGLTAFALGAVLALGLAACGGDDDDAAGTADTTAGDAAGEVTTTAGAATDDPYGSPSGDGSDDTTDATDAGAAGGEAVAYEVTEIQYEDVTAPAGGTIEVTNSSQAPHTFTADDGSFDVAYEPGDTATVDVPAEPGEYTFHCEIHPSMQATVTAQ
jgi:plastocyanin